MYSVLEYMHSAAARTQQWDSRLLGISLDLPSTHLDASKPFTLPTGKGSAADSVPTSFLWEGPNSNAVLYTGEKWVELHAFVLRLLELQRRGAPRLPPLFADKLVSKRYPSWLEHALKLSRARGYWTLYPSRATAGSLALVHNELYRVPEEYEGELKRSDGRKKLPEGTLAPTALVDTLPAGGRLLPFDEMPLLLWDGRATTLKGLDTHAAEYAAEFRKAVGGCEVLTPSDLLPKKSSRDLFCLKDD